MSLYLSLCVFILPVYFQIRLFVFPSVYLFYISPTLYIVVIYPALCLFILYLSSNLAIYLPPSLFVFQSVYLSSPLFSLFIFHSTYSVYLSSTKSVYSPFKFQSGYLSSAQFICLPLCLFILSIYLPLRLFILYIYLPLCIFIFNSICKLCPQVFFTFTLTFDPYDEFIMHAFSQC